MLDAAQARPLAGATILGIRPEYVVLAEPGQPGAVPGVVTQAQDIGTYWLVSAKVEGVEAPVRARITTNGHRSVPAPGDAVSLALVGSHTCFYKDEKLIPRDANDAGPALAVQEASPT